MTEQDFFNEQQEDAKRFKNFILLVITVAVVMAAMIIINL